MHVDDSAIVRDEVLYRRVARYGDTSMFKTDEQSGQLVLSSGAFAWDDDGCSVYRAKILALKNLGPETLVRHPQNVVFSITAGQARDAELGVRPDPYPTSDLHDREAAHALLVNPKGLSKKALRTASRILARQVIISVSPP